MLNDTTLAPVDPNLNNSADGDTTRRDQMGRMRAATLTLDEARIVRDQKMEQVLSNAEAITNQWGRTAFTFLVTFAGKRELFIANDVVEASRGQIEQPHDTKAWGPIFQRALKTGAIERVGYAQAPHRHASPCPEYRSLVWRTAA